jgi:hypothetical protein
MGKYRTGLLFERRMQKKERKSLFLVPCICLLVQPMTATYRLPIHGDSICQENVSA